MADEVWTKTVTLVAGAFLGFLGTAATDFVKRRRDRLAEERKARHEFATAFIEPMRLSCRDLSEKLRHVAEELKKGEVDGYWIHRWFERCKTYIVDANDGWSDEQRRRELAMHSGGIGYDAVSTLYLVASYLFYATSARFRIAGTSVTDLGDECLKLIDEVRSGFAALEFYPVTQDTVGMSMRGPGGRLLIYREFCEALTDGKSRAWFMTLADAFFKAHRHPDRLIPIADKLDRLGRTLLQ
jgi:hypothetical protein